MKTKRQLTAAARSKMSAGSLKARHAVWGDRRKPAAKVTIDADVARAFCAAVIPRDRRAIATAAIAAAIPGEQS